MSQNKPGPRELALRAMREQRAEKSTRKIRKIRKPDVPNQSAKENEGMPKKVAKNGGSKTEIVAGLLKRKNGCTGKDVKEATGWPTISMPAIAKACGLKLRKEKTDKGMRYYGSAA